MSVTTTPPPAPPKKKGLGCLGCGCLVLAIIVVLLVGLVGGACYLAYQKAVSLTTMTPTDVPTFNAPDDAYNATVQKLRAFGHDVENHQTSTLTLSADEINTLIARNPNALGPKVRLFVTLTNDEARLQGSLPTEALSQGYLKDRYFSFDGAFGLGFNPDAKNINLDLHRFEISDQTTPANMLPTMQNELNLVLNAQLQKNQLVVNFLQQTKSIAIKDGQLVIETQ
jgi:hypothetical protein